MIFGCILYLWVLSIVMKKMLIGGIRFLNINIILTGIIFLLLGGISQVSSYNPIFKLYERSLIEFSRFCYIISIILNGIYIVLKIVYLI